MKIKRHFTKASENVFDSVEWDKRSSKITNLDGSVVFEMNDAQVPASWSQLATDIMVSKYFRKAGVPQDGGPNGLPAPGYEKTNTSRDREGAGSESPDLGPEKSAAQVIHRLAGCWTHWGKQYGYFSKDADAKAFYDEMCYMLLTQMAAPNSPQWFNTGLNWAYGINGPAQGHHYTDPKTGETRASEDAYTHPQPHACFIQSVDDDLVNEGGIMNLWTREARLFKYGSGTGTNFSNIRAENEPLSGGGKSSGLMSFLKIGDRAAGAIKSGGTTRRAAKMVCLDLDHPDIESFVNWKVREEIKVAAMVEGLKHIAGEKASERDLETIGETAARLGLELDYDFNGETYQTVSGQNSNNSVRINNKFFDALDHDDQWELVSRTTGKVIKKMPARQLWEQIGYAAWRCADPGVQYDTTINQWHTCPESGRINASNPCSEYMFLDDTACNLASLNLMKFYDSKSRSFDLVSYEHAIKLWTIVLEISVLMAQYPSKQIARLSFEYRTLGLGFANLGAMLMQAGVPYDSDRARALAGCLSAIMTGRSYATSAAIAAEQGPFPGYFKNRDSMLRVIRNHRRAAYGVSRDMDLAQEHELGRYEGLDIKPVPIDAGAATGLDEVDAHIGKLNNGEDVVTAARAAWDDALALGDRHGYRNAQVSVIAPTGTIGLLMDCDTTGVEPDFALVKFKKLAGGGYFKIANQSLRPALTALGYAAEQVDNIMAHVLGKLTLEVAMPGNDDHDTFADYLRDAGLTDAELEKITKALPTVFDLSGALNAWSLGPEAIERMGLTEAAKDPSFNLLKAIGLDYKQIKLLNMAICGTQTVEGAADLKDEHLPVFDCANKCGPLGQRYIAPQGHIRMMAAAQPFISGAISKTINLPNEADVEAITSAYRLSWELGLKANALYRDGCKLSQPLNTSSGQEDDGVEDDEAIEAGKDEVAQQVTAAAQAASDAIEDGQSMQVVEKIVEKVVHRPMRKRLPDTRSSKTHKFNVGGHEGYLTVGLYDDGTPGELFITMAKEGSTIGGLMDSLGTAISVALQYGVPVESLVTKFTHQRFEPAGMTHNPDIPFAKSLVDYIFRWMGMEFVSGYRAANAPQRALPKDDRDTSAAKAKSAAVASGSNGSGNGKSADNGNGQSKDTSAEATSDHSDLTDPPRRLPPAGNGRQAQPVKVTAEATANAGSTGDALASSMKNMQEDAPACDVCGTITVRNGTCYKCMNCGNSMGCS